MTALPTFLVFAAAAALILLLRREGFTRAWAALLPLAGAAAFFGLRAAGLSGEQAGASAIFLFSYMLIVSDKVHRTTAALAGACAMLLLGLIDQHTALYGHGEVEGCDWNTVLLLVGMMVVVNVTRHTGVFNWIAIKAVKVARGHVVAVMVLLCTATALLSAVLDNVTTVLLLAPVTLLVCADLELDPVPMLILVALASNVGGTATLIGDPTHIMIASAAHLGFMDFLQVDAPIIALVFVVNMLTVWLFFRRRARVSEAQRARAMAMDEKAALTDPKLLRRCGVVIALVLVGFAAHDSLGVEPATVALAGAAALLLMQREGPERALRQVEWPTIIFFVGLFVMVTCLVQVGVVRLVAEGILKVTCGGPVHGSLDPSQRTFLTLGVCWFSALASGLINTIPFVAAMNAVIRGMAVSLHPGAGPAAGAALAHSPDILPLWWALSLSACLGGNFTLVGASPNVVVAGFAEHAKHPISFWRFMKYGVPLTLQGILLVSIYLWLRFLR